MAKYVMTAKRKAALRKAQLVSARKRRGKGNKKLAKAHRRSSRNAKIVLATGGLAGAAAMAGAMYYTRKTARGGPKPKKVSHSAVVARMNLDNAISNAQRTLNRTRRGAPRSNSLKAVGYSFGYQANYAAAKARRPRRGAPSSRSEKAGSARIRFDHARLKPYWRQQDAVWKAKKKRGLFKTAHAKAKYRRRNEAKRKKKNR